MKSLKIISLLLCFILVISTLFSCGKEEEGGDGASATVSAGEVLIPNFSYKATANVTSSFVNNPEYNSNVPNPHPLFVAFVAAALANKK